MLGHSDVRITLQTYVHVSLRHKQQAVQSICFLPICGGDFAPSEIPSGAAKSRRAARRSGAGFLNDDDLRKSYAVRATEYPKTAGAQSAHLPLFSIA